MLSAAHTDVGISKKINQDSCLVKEAVTSNGTILFAAICDGMGGLKNGEVASACVVKDLNDWFEYSLPVLAYDGFTVNALKQSLNRMIFCADEKIKNYGERKGACGTTLSGVLLAGGRYLTVNIGDSRVYRIGSDGPHQLTHDQTLAQQRADEGKITQQEAMTDPGQSVLLQCIGSGGEVVPSYTEGTYEPGAVFFLCSDGYRHRLSADELGHLFSPKKMTTESSMKKALRTGAETVKQRNERDNITAILLCTTEHR